MTQVKTTKLDWIRDAVTIKYVEEEYTIQKLQGWLKDTYGLHAALGTITSALANWGIKREDAKHKMHYPLDHSALDNWDDPEVQYWLDFLADNSALGKGVVIVSVAPIDAEELVKLRHFLKTTKPMEPPKDSRVRLRIYSPQILEQVRRAKERAHKEAV